MLKTLIFGFSIGLATALGSILAHLAFGIVFATWTIWIWPSSILLLGTAGHERSGFSLMTVAIAVLLNGAIYLVLALILWKLVLNRRT
jgi:hypothetical protein